MLPLFIPLQSFQTLLQTLLRCQEAHFYATEALTNDGLCGAHHNEACLFRTPISLSSHSSHLVLFPPVVLFSTSFQREEKASTSKSLR